eukprot:TRINITY_DN3143_c0_g1_i2.p1 TRINITY_DN3143_c0_g1~~TRINITY_DN3143_c0_g1_i2.p1  ORF type:complete len:307 (+),score=48.14 TRINITY_DN3143_c0_g1_i2:199-1119(+)
MGLLSYSHTPLLLGLVLSMTLALTIPTRLANAEDARVRYQQPPEAVHGEGNWKMTVDTGGGALIVQDNTTTSTTNGTTSSTNSSVVKLSCFASESVTYGSLTVGDRIPVCLRMRKGDEERKAVFYPAVDKFAALTITGSFVDGFAKDADIGVEVGGQVTQQYRRFSTGDVIHNDLYYAIVALKKGRVQNVTWDETPPCTQEVCENLGGACVSGEQDFSICGAVCADETEEKLKCDVRVHLVWIGSDKTQFPLTTAGIRQSLWSSFTFGAAAAGVKAAAKKAAAGIANATAESPTPLPTSGGSNGTI